MKYSINPDGVRFSSKQSWFKNGLMVPFEMSYYIREGWSGQLTDLSHEEWSSEFSSLLYSGPAAGLLRFLPATVTTLAIVFLLVRPYFADIFDAHSKLANEV